MEPIYLHHVEETAKASEAGGQFAAMEAQGIPVPQIRYLFAYKPRTTEHLALHGGGDARPLSAFTRLEGAGCGFHLQPQSVPILNRQDIRVNEDGCVHAALHEKGSGWKRTTTSWSLFCSCEIGLWAGKVWQLRAISDCRETEWLVS